MKKILFTILVSVTLAVANPVVVISGGSRGTSASGVEGFEGTGTPSAAWTDISTGGVTVNWDYTASPIAGSQSVQLLDSASGTKQFMYNFPQDVDEIWVAWRYRQSSDPAVFNGIMNIIDVSQNSLGTVRIQTDGSIVELVQGVASSAVIDLTPGSNYRFKVRYKKGTGANEEMQLWCVADGAGSWGASVLQVNGTSTVRADAVYWSNPASTNHDQVIDNVIVSTSDIALSDLD